MRFYSVPASDILVVEALVAIARAPSYKERRAQMAALEAQGYAVLLTPSGPVARSGSQEYRLPRVLCPACRQVKAFDSFLSIRGVEHPWCAPLPPHPNHLRGLDTPCFVKSNPHRESGTRCRAAADVGVSGRALLTVGRRDGRVPVGRLRWSLFGPSLCSWIARLSPPTEESLQFFILNLVVPPMLLSADETSKDIPSDCLRLDV